MTFDSKKLNLQITAYFCENWTHKKHMEINQIVRTATEEYHEIAE